MKRVILQFASLAAFVAATFGWTFHNINMLGLGLAMFVLSIIVGE